MRIGTSLGLIAVGLVLAYALTDDPDIVGLDVQALGAILFLVGLLGLAVTVALLEIEARRYRPRRAPRPVKAVSDEPRRRAPAARRDAVPAAPDDYDPIQPLPPRAAPVDPPTRPLDPADAPTTARPRPRPRL